jgi:membrane-associated protein
MHPAPLLAQLGAPAVAVIALLGKLEPEHLLDVFGTAGLITIIFAESGLLIGFFLPGDSLLFFAGFLASDDKLNLAVILPGCFLAAVLGDQVGYMFGQKVGPRLFDKPNSRFFKQAYLVKTNEYFAEHGPKTILLARFVPVVRTFAPIMAGVGEMRYRTFLAWNVVGGFIWSFGAILLGYFLGDALPDQWFEPAVVAVVILSTIPIVLEYRKQRRELRAGSTHAAASASAPTSSAPAAGAPSPGGAPARGASPGAPSPGGAAPGGAAEAEPVQP